MHKPIARKTQKRSESEFISISNDRVLTPGPQILRAVTEFYTQRPTDKPNSSDEKHQLWKTRAPETSSEVHGLSGLPGTKEIKLVKNPPEEEPGNFPGKFYETCKKEIIENLHNIF